jgi:hypothetical protein
MALVGAFLEIGVSSQQRPHKADRRWNSLRKQKLPQLFLDRRN